jgi:hypothetical protein
MDTTQQFHDARQKHITVLQAKIDRLLRFEMQDFQKWEIPFDIEFNRANPFPWHGFPEIEQLPFKSTQPAVYYFSTKEKCEKHMFDFFSQAKKNSKNRSLEGTYNVSHVPKKFKDTSCIYAGSVSTGLHSRLVSHLGLGNPGTGALYLIPVLHSLPERPKIYFNFQFLDYKDLPIVEHIERLLQDSLDPLIGRKSLSRLDKEHMSISGEF